MSSGSKPVTTIGNFVFRGNRNIFFVTHDGADVAGGEESLNHAVLGREQRFHRGRNEDVRNQQREISDAVVIGLPRGHGVGGCSGFEADSKEDDLLLGIGPGQFQRVQRRINDADVGAFRLRIEQALRRSGHAQHVSEGAEDNVGSHRDGDGFVDQLNRRDADRTTGAVYERDFAGQQVFEGALDDGVGLAAADFHDRPRASDFVVDGLR